MVLETHERTTVGKEFHARRGPATQKALSLRRRLVRGELHYLVNCRYRKTSIPCVQETVLSCWNMFWIRKRRDRSVGISYRQLGSVATSADALSPLGRVRAKPEPETYKLPLQQQNNSFFDFDLILPSNRHSNRLTDRHKVSALLLLLPSNKVEDASSQSFCEFLI